MDMAKSMICRTCGGTAKPDLSLDLFAPEQSALLEYIRRTSNVTIRFLENLPTHICKNCQAEVIFPRKFITRYANTQYFFMSNAYLEKLKLLEKFGEASAQAATAYSFNNHDVKTDNINTKDDSSTDSDTEISPVGTGISILSTEDFFRSKKKFQKYMKRKKGLADRQYFKCDICKNLISDRGNFITHMKRHAGIKPYQCEMCPKKFISSTELNTHVRSHTGERPHKCKHCDRGFVSTGTKNAHEKTHSTFSPFICEFCGLKFRKKDSLTRHSRKHTQPRPHIKV